MSQRMKASDDGPSSGAARSRQPVGGENEGSSFKNPLSPATEDDDASPIFTKISKDLQDKIINFPQYTVAPFFIENVTRGRADYDDDGHWKWNNDDYVRLPTSPLYKSRGNQVGDDGDGKNWDIIQKQLGRLHKACKNNDLKDDLGRVLNVVMRSYSPDADHRSNFGILSRPDLQNGLIETLPIIVDQALSLPNLLAEPIPILKNGVSKTLYLSRKLCASILANAFFCTFPDPSRQRHQIPDVNFFRLFHDAKTERCDVRMEKIKCMLNYFQIIGKMDESFVSEIVSFERRCVKRTADWQNSDKGFCEVLVDEYDKIEDAEGFLQVDFANKLIGGGVLNESSNVEEIRFSISPELIVSRLFTEALSNEEVVVITGSQIYSQYSGYGTTFKYDGVYDCDLISRSKDSFGRTFEQVVAMDALIFKKNDRIAQHQKNLVDRELHKCYAAFIHGKKVITPVATGNWGCGGLNGDSELKFLIQWMAASYQDRPLLQYHTLGDQKQGQEIEDIAAFIQDQNVTVGQVYQTLSLFYGELQGNPSCSLFQYLKDTLGGQGYGGVGGGSMG